MKSRMKFTDPTSNGFTLVEVLTALALFSLAMLGIAFFTGKAIKYGIDDNVRGMALYVANQAVEPLKASVKNKMGYPGLRNAILAFDTDASAATVSQEVSANNDKDKFIVAITAAQDKNNLDVLNNATPNLWVRPINMSVTITNKESANIVARANYTLFDY